MARIESDPNYTAPTFSRATAPTDPFKKEDVQNLAAAFSTHVHDGAGKGLVVAPPANSIHGSWLVDATVSNGKLMDSTIFAGKINPSVTIATFQSQGIWAGSGSSVVAVPATAWTTIPISPTSFGQGIGAVGSIVGGMVNITQAGLYMVFVQAYFTSNSSNGGAVYLAVSANGGPATMAFQTLMHPAVCGTMTQHSGMSMFPLQNSGTYSLAPMVYSGIAGTASGATLMAFLVGHL